MNMERVSSVTAGLALVVVFLVGAIVSFLLWGSPVALGSVGVSDEYTATTTAASSVDGATITGSKLVITGAGTLGSVVVTGANTGVFTLYDATTSNVNLRTGQKATSSIEIASFAASLVGGTYTFDTSFKDGLLINLVTGAMPTTTITYRR